MPVLHHKSMTTKGELGDKDVLELILYIPAEKEKLV